MKTNYLFMGASLNLKKILLLLLSFILIFLSLFTTSCNKLDVNYNMMNPDLNNRFPESLPTLISNLEFPNGNLSLHQFVLDNPYNNHEGYQVAIGGILQAMKDVTSVNILNDQGNSALHLAVLENNIVMVRELLSNLRHINVYTRDRNGNTALHLAVELGHVSIAKEFLKNGVDVNAKNQYDQTPLHLATDVGNKNMIKLLLENGANMHASDNKGHCPFHIAAKKVDVMEYLIQNMGDLNILDGKGETWLHWAARLDKFDVAKLLLENGADIHKVDLDGQTPLHQAAGVGDRNMVKLLLENGADVHAKTTHQGYTPLYMALKDGAYSAVQLLLDEETDINAIGNSDSTLLHRAKESGAFDAAELLLKNGADIHTINNYGNTLLHQALMVDAPLPTGRGLVQGLIMARFLVVNKGVNVNVKNKNDQTPLEMVESIGYVRMASLFKSLTQKKERPAYELLYLIRKIAIFS